MIKNKMMCQVMAKMKWMLSVCLLASFGLTAHAQTAKNHRFEVAKNLDLFNNIYKNLDLMYVDTLNPVDVIGTGIRAMLGSLDPYTEYYPESETKNLRSVRLSVITSD